MDINFSETLKYKCHLNKFVKVQTVDRICHEGWMKALDPLSGNIILVTLNNDKSKITKSTLIISEACVSVNVDESVPGTLPDLSLGNNTSLTPAELEELKGRLVTWIKKHRLPVTEDEDGSLIVCDSVTIRPPYRPENCISKNVRILQKTSEIIESLPAEIETIETQLKNAVEEVVTA
ncbi:gem-associated protein 6-like [Parasteatoda tepidariorum]|uniref:gem-associated protein 6-like n=1 Tax=Parasteatoda tepidariorum TaxID=114398 RepID=UPI00077F8D47|nr:gem-associated protein 6-like [Parasteatoda tepidariorum]